MLRRHWHGYGTDSIVVTTREMIMMVTPASYYGDEYGHDATTLNTIVTGLVVNTIVIIGMSAAGCHGTGWSFTHHVVGCRIVRTQQ